MLRLILLSVPAFLIMLGFALPFVIQGGAGYFLALLSILIGAAALWFIDNKTINHLNKDGMLNKILNTKDGPD